MMLAGTLGDAISTTVGDTTLSVDYGGALDQIAPGFTSYAQQIAAPGEDWISAASRALSALAMTDAQRRLLNIQIQRAQQGLPPLDSSQYGLGVSVGLGADTQKLILIGLALLAAAILLPKLMKGR